MTPQKISNLIEQVSAELKNSDIENLSQIEYDMIMQHLRSLYEELYQLKNKHEDSGLAKNAIKNPTPAENSEPLVLPSKKTFFANKHLLLNDVQPVNKEYPDLEDKPTTKKTIEATTKPVEKPEKKSSPSSLNDNIKSVGSLNEKLKSASGTEVHKKLSSRPLKDLIDLNNRFVLLNELFKGNAEAFSASIHHIDSLDDFQSAETFIQSQLVSNYYWDQSSQSAKLFLRLVKQKFGII